MDGRMDGWMDGCLACDLIPFLNSISVISGQWVGGNERLCEMQPQSQLKIYLPRVGLEPGTASSTGQLLT